MTYGDPLGPADVQVEQAPEVIAKQIEKLTAACEATERDVGELEQVLLQGPTAGKPLQSVDAFVDWAGKHQELVITELVIHWPAPDSIFENDLAVFEKIATEGLAQLNRESPPERAVHHPSALRRPPGGPSPAAFDPFPQVRP